MNKKVAILCFADNSEIERLDYIETTYMSNVFNDEVDGFSFYGCVSMTDEEIRNAHHKHVGTYKASEGTVYVPVTAKNSYKKFECVIKTIHNYLEDVDYLLITNVNTYINVEMMYQFVNSLNENDETIYCSEILTSEKYSGPYDYCVFANCNAVLLPLKFYGDVLMKTEYKKLVSKLDENRGPSIRDTKIDYAMGNLIDSYLINQLKEHSTYYRNWNHININNIDLDNDNYYNYMTIDLSGYNGDIESLMDEITTDVNSVDNQEDVLNEFFSDKSKYVVHNIDTDEYTVYSEYAKIIKTKSNTSSSLSFDTSYDTYWKWFNIFSYYPYWINSTHGLVLMNGSSFTNEDLEEMRSSIDMLYKAVTVQQLKINTLYNS